jgi:glutathione synthase/RimK-type ligase-like ATP-grasp enzyme
VPKGCKKIVKKLYRELGFDFVGIDFIFHNGKLVLNEIEDPVGCRMLYSFGKIDAIKKYLKRIKKHLKKV